LPHPDHVVVVVMENRSFDDIIGNPRAPYINGLAAGGALFTRSYAVAHPSQPNYLALFSGSTQGVTSDACPLSFGGPNLATSLVAAGYSFTGYAEDLPSPGYTGCSAAGSYARKHSPWVNFTNVPASANQPLTSFPSRYAALPTVSFVIPNLDNDMHDGTLAQADSWLHTHLGGYAAWAAAHNSLLVVTADEDDRSSDNRIATLLVGQPVAPGRYSERIDHYSVLRTIEDAYGLPRLGASAQAAPITGVWRG
jgi:phosphatidylinositol-3-phosphatase